MNIYQRIAADEEFMLRRDDALSFCSQNHTTYYATFSIRHRYVWVTNKKKHRTGNLNAPSSTRVQFALYCKCISYNINTYTIYTYVHTRCTFTHIFSSHHWQYIVRRNLITFRILRCVCVRKQKTCVHTSNVNWIYYVKHFEQEIYILSKIHLIKWNWFMAYVRTGVQYRRYLIIYLILL